MISYRVCRQLAVFGTQKTGCRQQEVKM